MQEVERLRDQLRGAVEENERLKHERAEAIALALMDDADWIEDDHAALRRLTGGQ